MTLPRSREVEEAVSAARGTVARVRAGPDMHGLYRTRRRARRMQRFAVTAVIGLFALLVASFAWALIIEPLGIIGLAMMVMLALVVVMGAGALSRERRVAAASIGAPSEMAEVAERADRFLDQQRRALPAPAQDLSDLIARRISAMAPQLETLEANAPEAHELRRLLGDELPELVTSYGRVPPHLRREDRNGRVPETDLIDGLKLVDGKLDSMARNLAAADMDRLSSQKRYLEIRYDQDQPTGG